MDRVTAAKYVEMARERPDILCAEVPVEVLEAGHRQFLIEKQGRVRKSDQMVKNAVVVLWVRATRLYNNRSLNRLDPDEDRPFFSDEGLY